jgi:2'-phosphotransferase
MIAMGLCKVLRHDALRLYIIMGSDGYVSFNDLIKLSKFSMLTLEMLFSIVKTDDKMRFSVKICEDKWYVRCNQGHSFPEGTIDPNKLLTPITMETSYIFPFVVHGCPLSSWLLIKGSSLDKMGRQHVHMATGLPESGTVISGMRTRSQVTIEIDLPAALAAGIRFFVSSNGVVLSPGPIPPLFFKKVIERKSGKVLFPLPSCEHTGCETILAYGKGLCEKHKYCTHDECMETLLKVDQSALCKQHLY